MNALIFAEAFRNLTPRQFRTPAEEDSYYRSREPSSHGNGFPVATVVALAGFAAIVLNLLPL